MQEAAALTGSQRAELKEKLGLGLLYLAFDDHQEGLEACAAVEALIEISAIETLLASFIVPLQGGDVKAEVRTSPCDWKCTAEMCAAVFRHACRWRGPRRWQTGDCQNCSACLALQW